MSLAAKMALITATPQMPLPHSCSTLCAPMPPMATTGMETARQMARRVSRLTSSASALEPVGNTAPTPR